MTQIIAGHNLGLLFGSFTLLNRADTSGAGTLGHGAQSFANVANGNLLLQERDVFLPAAGEDFTLVRTYNSRADGSFVNGWTFSTGVTLTSHLDRVRTIDPAGGGTQKGWTIFYGDGTEVEFAYDAARKLWVSTDGPGAYETLRALGDAATDAVRYVVTRADQSQYGFDTDLRLRRIVDANGVTTTFSYSGTDLVRVTQDGSHVVTFGYTNGRLTSVSDESLASPLVRYGWTGGNLTSVTDRAGHVTSYRYNADGLIDRVTLPSTQVVNGQAKTYDTRTVSFKYKSVRWDDHPWWGTAFDSGDAWVLTEITDAAGGVTSFDYDFQFGSTPAAGDRDIPYSLAGTRFFQGATTRVVDALGNARAFSNDAEYVAWRVANGYYRTYPGTGYTLTSTMQAQIAAIRNAASVTYTVDANGQLTRVTDELGFQTVYAYDGKGNLSSITDANGYGAVTSDSDYFRKLRAELGYRDAGGVVGRTAASLTAAEKAAILARFTSVFTYDAGGNLLTRRDNAGSVTTYQYTAFNKVASMTTPDGHVTTYEYDARQNLSRRVDGTGNVVDWQYDALGNLARRIVYLDKTSLADPSKQQVTQYFHDAFGNNTRTIDAEGGVTLQSFDHLGNVLTSTDARGSVTTFAYDADNRLLSVTTPEGSTTSYAYDAVGNRIAITDANGHTVTRVFDRNNLLLATIDPAASAARTRSTESVYDVLGNATSTTDAEGRVTTYAFDARRQLVRVQSGPVQDASDRTVSYERTLSYDGTGNVVRATDFNGNVTQTLYTTDGLVRRVTDPVGNVTEYLYTADRMQLQVTIGAQLIDAAKRRVLTFGYDEEDRLATETDTLGTARVTRYDAVGNVASLTDADGFTTSFSYDRNNRLLRETRPAVDVGGNPVRYEVVHAYDSNGNEVSTTDENGRTTTVAFDKDNRAVLVTDPNGIRTAYRYDARGNRTTVWVGVAAHVDANRHLVIDDERPAQVRSFEYDEFNQLVAATDAVGNALATSNDETSRQMRVALGYAADAGALSATARAALRELYTDRFQYDRVGGEVLHTDHLDRVTATAYDALGRVASVTEAQGTGVARTTQYRYDGNGNLARTVGPNGRVTRTTYDANDRVVDETDAAGNVTRDEYDAFGNLVAQTLAWGTAQARTTRWAYDVRGRIVEQRSPPAVVRGGGLVPVVTSYAYDGEGRLVSRTTRADGEAQAARIRVERFEYDAIGRLVAQVNGEGERTEIAWDGAGRRLRITVAPGVAGVTRVNAFEYDDGGRLVAEVDGEGVRTEYRYDAFGNRVEIVQAANRAGEARHTLLTYDADNRLTSVTDPIGWARAYSDEAAFRAWRTAHGFADSAAGVQAAGQSDAILATQRTRYELDSLGNQVRVTDAAGTVTENTFDALGRVLTSTVDAGGARGGVRTTNTYDVFGNVTSSRQAWVDAGTDGGDARTTTYEYDVLDRQTRVTDGEGFSTLLAYDAFGNVTRIVRGAYTGSDSAKRAAAFGWSAATGGGYAYDLAYDALDRLLSTVDGRGNAVRNTWNAFGDRVSQTTGETSGADAAHASTQTFVYDLAGRLVERRIGDGVVQLAYDAAGNLVGQWTLQSRGASAGSTTRTLSDGTSITGRWTEKTFEADGNGRTTASVDSYGTRTEHHFDAVGNETRTVYAQGTAQERTLHAEFDLDNRRVADVDALGHRTAYGYDAAGHRVSRTDALGNVTRWYFDALGRERAQLDARGFLVAYAYDAAGNRVSSTTFMSALSPTVVGDGSAMPTLPGVDPARDRVATQVFDRASRLVRRTEPDGAVTTYAYDGTDKLLKKTQLGSGDAALLARTADKSARVMTWTYDASGRIAVFTNVDGVTETYAYDAANNKVLETVRNPNPLPGGRADPDRVTEFAYDLDNRLILQRFHLNNPDGASQNAPDPLHPYLDQALAYDLAGNVVRKTEAGAAHDTAYDLENRVASVTDPLSGVTRYGYDRLGNLVAVTDALGREYAKVYDLNNRLVEETSPEVDTTTLGADGHVTGVRTRPTTRTAYDARGSVASVTDANGNVTTNWYDATGNLVAQRNGDGAVRLYTFDATGAMLTATLDSARRTGAGLTSAALPTLQGTGNTLRYAYDLGGRLVRTTYDAIQVTTLQGTGTASPSASTATLAPENLFEFDAFGNAVRTRDRNGHWSTAWFDRRGRVVASADAAGYLIETDYDDQGRVVQQRRYASALAGTISAAQRPAAPAGQVVKVDRLYDSAGRLIEETSGAVATEAGSLRVVTRFAYDLAGNLVRRTLGYATVNASGLRAAGAAPRSEYYVYDAANRRRAVIDASRVLSVYGYDAVGNLTSQKRYFDTVNGNVVLADVGLDDVLHPLGLGVSASATRDEAVSYAYDEANRLVARSDEMRLDASDELVEQMGYDAAGNRTWGHNADGYETFTRFDAAGRVVEVVTPDGRHAYTEYDTGGLKVAEWLGAGPDAHTPVASAVDATAVNGASASLEISWDVASAGVTSWVAWDTVSHADASLAAALPSPGAGTPGVYAHATGGSAGAGTLSSRIVPPSGQTVYFRIVTSDGFGVAWTAEQSVSLPSRVVSERVTVSGGNATLVVTFSEAVASAALVRSDGGTPADYSVTPASGPAATWSFTFSGAADDLFHLEWVAGGTTLTTDDVALLQAPGGHVGGTDGWVSLPVPTDGTAVVGSGQYVLVDGALLEDPSIMGTIDGTAATPSVTRWPAAGTTPLPAQATLQFEPPGMHNGDQVSYDVLYGTLGAFTHSAGVSFTQRQYATYAFSHYITHDAGGTTVYDFTVYDVTWHQDAPRTQVSATLSSSEWAQVAGGLRVSTRAAQEGTGGFGAGVAASRVGNTGSADLALAAGSWDVKIWYLDALGREVVVEWRRVTVPDDAALPANGQVQVAGKDVEPVIADVVATPGAAHSYTGDRSLLRLASETGGRIDLHGHVLSVTPGEYSGPLDPRAMGSQLQLATTAGTHAGERIVDSRDAQTYFTRIEYNALGVKVATNEGSGLWRRLDVDANGNALRTRLYGTREAETNGDAPIVTYAAFDVRNLEVARFGADVGGRAVTRTTYDFAERAVSVLDPEAGAGHERTTAYDGAGNVVSTVDAQGIVTTMAYDVFGARVRTIEDDTGARRIRRKVYDGGGRLVEEYVVGATDHRYYGVDAFGRTTSVATGLLGGAGGDDVTRYTLEYDQRDRVAALVNGAGGRTEYTYDGRDNLVWTKDPGGHWFGTAYDGMNRATHQYSFQSHWTDASGDHVADAGQIPVTLANVLAAVGNAASPFHATLRDAETVYDPFGNKIAEVDAEGRRHSYTYGAFGRLSSSSVGAASPVVVTVTYDRFGNKLAETSTAGKDIVYAWDAAARLTAVEDRTTLTRTQYAYDKAGHRTSEVLGQGAGYAQVHATTYQYNRNGWLTNWQDAVTGIGERIAYDGLGNVTSIVGLSGATTIFTHTYTFDVSGRVRTAVGDAYAHDDLDATGDTYEYDARGRRIAWTHAGSRVEYAYDDADRITKAGVKTGGAFAADALSWAYDAAGNVTTVSGQGKSTVYSYDLNNVSWKSVSDVTSTTYFDRAGRVVKSTTQPDADTTYTYVYAYNADGTESGVTASGSASGSALMTYDANGRLVQLNLGTGDSTNVPSLKTFTYDNQGHVVSAATDKAAYPTRNFLYANDQPVGEYGSDATKPWLDTGSIEQGSGDDKWHTGEMTAVRDIPDLYGDGPEFPSNAAGEHVVAAGETLQSIASSTYGHPELWFVIADANGLSGSEALAPGTRLSIPNSVQFSGLTSETHPLYNEGQIVGSKLPNLLSPPPPPKDTCAVIGAIIAIVVVSIIAVVATVLTAGALGPAAFAAIGGTTAAVGSVLWVTAVVVGVVVAAAVGAAIAFTASALTQAILIGFDLQESFDWSAVAADVVAGAFSGAAIGLGAIVGSIAKITTAIRIVDVVGQTALELGGEALRQQIVNGHVDDFTSLAIAGVGGALGSIAELAESSKLANQAAAKLKSGAAEAAKAVEIAQEVGEQASKGWLRRAYESVKNAVVWTGQKLYAAGQWVANGVKSFVELFPGGAMTGRNGLVDMVGIIQDSGKTLEAINASIKAARAIEWAAKIPMYAMKIGAEVWNLTSQQRREQVGRTSVFQFGSAGAVGFLTGSARLGRSIAGSVGMVSNAAGASAAAQTAAWESNLASTAVAARAAMQSTGLGASAPRPVDAATITAFVRERGLGHGWSPTVWLDAAATAASQIVRPIQGVPTLADTLRYKRLAAGETARFDRASIVALAAGIAGQVATNAVPLPIALLDASAPRAGA